MNEPRIEKKESQSSFEFGKAASRFKLYFWTVKDLQERLKEIGELKTTEEWLKTFVE